MKCYEYDRSKRVWAHILEEKAQKNGEKVYVYFKDQRITYRGLNENANKLANGYTSIGVKKGDKVSIMMPNCLEFLYHWFALSKIGAVDNPINVAYKGDSLRHVITNSDARFLLIHEQFLDRFEFIQNELPDMEAVIVYPAIPSGHKLKFPTYSFKDLLTSPPEFSPTETVRPSDPFQIIYTSGTTGLSKGVVLSHSCVYHYATDLIRLQGLNHDTRTYNCLPLFHQNHRFTSTCTLLTDGTYVMGERFSASTFWNDIRKYEVNHFHFLGAMMQIMYKQPPKPDDPDNPVKTAWGGPIPVSIAAGFENRFGLKLYCGVYGLSEASSITTLSFQEADELKAKGKWAQAVGMGREQKEIYEVKLVDDDDQEVPDGTPGEIICRPARTYSMMTEYINNPQATAAVFKNLWFHTGDLGVKDADGYYHFVDRKKDYLRRRGENISSFEVEKVVNAHDAVLDSAVIGAKSELGEDEIRVLIQLKEGEHLTPEELMAWCEPRMAYFMVPRFVDFVTDFPRSPVGRIEKYKLREIGLGNSWDRENEGYKLTR